MYRVTYIIIMNAFPSSPNGIPATEEAIGGTDFADLVTGCKRLKGSTAVSGHLIIEKCVLDWSFMYRLNEDPSLRRGVILAFHSKSSRNPTSEPRGLTLVYGPAIAFGV